MTDESGEGEASTMWKDTALFSMYCGHCILLHVCEECSSCLTIEELRDMFCEHEKKRLEAQKERVRLLNTETDGEQHRKQEIK